MRAWLRGRRKRSSVLTAAAWLRDGGRGRGLQGDGVSDGSEGTTRAHAPNPHRCSAHRRLCGGGFPTRDFGLCERAGHDGGATGGLSPGPHGSDAKGTPEELLARVPHRARGRAAGEEGKGPATGPPRVRPDNAESFGNDKAARSADGENASDGLYPGLRITGRDHSVHGLWALRCSVEACWGTIPPIGPSRPRPQGAKGVRGMRARRGACPLRTNGRSEGRPSSPPLRLP